MTTRNSTKIHSARRELLILGALGCLLLAAPAHAQATSGFTVQATGSVTTPTEVVNFSGPLQINVVTVPDPSGGPTTAVVSLEATDIAGTGATTGTSFINSGEARLTRVLAATDVVQTTFAFYQDVPGGFMKTRTALLTVNLTYDVASGALTGATASISTPSFR
jgi:hypothetical protein